MRIGRWLVQRFGSEFMVSSPSEPYTFLWFNTKESAIKCAIARAHGRGDYGAAVALIAEVMLNEKE